MNEPNPFSLVKYSGFSAVFEQFMAVTSSYKAAYELTEGIYERSFGERKYSSYESFQVVRCKMNKKKRTKTQA